MTEKRFMVVRHSRRDRPYWYDVNDNKAYNRNLYCIATFNNENQANHLCDLLNEQHEQIQSLQFQLKECREHKLYSRRELEKENEQLKKDLVEVHEICAYYESRIKELKR